MTSHTHKAREPRHMWSAWLFSGRKGGNARLTWSGNKDERSRRRSACEAWWNQNKTYSLDDSSESSLRVVTIIVAQEVTFRVRAWQFQREKTKLFCFAWWICISVSSCFDNRVPTGAHIQQRPPRFLLNQKISRATIERSLNSRRCFAHCLTVLWAVSWLNFKTLLR